MPFTPSLRARTIAATALCGLVLMGCGRKRVQPPTLAPAPTYQQMPSAPGPGSGVQGSGAPSILGSPAPFEPTPITPRDPSRTPLKVPGGSVDDFPAAPSDTLLETSGQPSGRYHRVRQGESMTAIAQQYGTTVEELSKVNGIDDPNRISEGQILFVPDAE